VSALTGAFDINDRRQIVGGSEPRTGNPATLRQPAARTGGQLLSAP
jgi:hypothetical protein